MMSMFWLFFADKGDPLLVKNGPYKPFTFSHMMVVLLSFVLVYMAIRYVRQKEYHTRFIWVCRAYILLVLLDVLRIVWDMYKGHFDIREDLPLQLCGIQMFIIPVALFSSSKIGEYTREFVYSYGITGFLLALILPLPTLYDFPVFHFRSMQSMMYHSFMGFVAFMMPHLNYVPDIRNIRKAYFVLIVCVLITGIVNVLIGSNYLYTAYLPIKFELLPWPSYLPFLFAFALLVGRLPYYAYSFFHEMSTSNVVDIK